MHSSFDQLCAAVSAGIDMPVGRVRWVALALEHQRLGPARGAHGSDSPAAQAGAPPEAAKPGNHLRWYPLGVRGRLRPQQPERP